MKTHPLNVSYLVLGLAFLGIAGSWALHERGVIGSNDVEWLLPMTLVVAGAVGLVAFMARGLSNRRTQTRATGDGDDTYYTSAHTPTYTSAYTPTASSDAPASGSDADPTVIIDDEGENR